MNLHTYNDIRFDVTYTIYADSETFIGAEATVGGFTTVRTYESLDQLPAHVRAKVESLLCLSSPTQR